MWLLVLVAVQAASSTPAITPILQTADQQTCLLDRQRLIDTRALNPDFVICLEGVSRETFQKSPAQHGQ